MSVEWYLAKYVSHVDRNEPVNVGLILLADGVLVATRFLGERPDGVIDGRAVRSVVRSIPTYKSWVAHWRSMAQSSDVEALGRAARQQSRGDNYRLEPGGEMMLGAPPNIIALGELADDLFSRLVDESMLITTETIVQVADSVIEAVQEAARIKIERENYIDLRVGNVLDQLRFDYRYNNGKPHLMQRVPLLYADQRSWERVHSVSWQFSRIQEAEDPQLRNADLIALVRPRDNDEMLERQLRQLEEHANVVDLREPDAAEARLLELISD